MESIFVKLVDNLTLVIGLCVLGVGEDVRDNEDDRLGRQKRCIEGVVKWGLNNWMEDDQG